MLDNKGFDQWADGYDEGVARSDAENRYPFAGYQRVQDRICAVAAQKPGAVVLDVGFGTAALTSRLYESGCEIWGQDFSEEMLRLAAEKMPEARLFLGDVYEGLATALKEQHYDLIIATYFLHHFSDEHKVRLVEELLALLAEDGELLIGDVAFWDRPALEACRRAAGEEWDDEEIYFVFDELKRDFPALRFEKLSPCAGLLRLKKGLRGKSNTAHGESNGRSGGN